MWMREDSVRCVCLYVTMPQAGGCRASWTALLGVSAPVCGHVQEGRRWGSLGSHSAASRYAAQSDAPFSAPTEEVVRVCKARGEARSL